MAAKPELADRCVAVRNCHRYDEILRLAEEEEVHYAPDAVLLRSTAFGALPALADFPEDTVICLRILSEVGAAKGKNREAYANAEATLCELFAYS